MGKEKHGKPEKAAKAAAKVAEAPAPAPASAGLSTLFSDAAKDKFARALKPEEFVSRQRPEGYQPRLDPEELEKQQAKLEKRKAKRAKRFEGQRLEKAEEAAVSRSQKDPAPALATTVVAATAPATATTSAPSAPSSSSSSVEDRSIFIGNVPLAPSPAQGINTMRAFCSKYGEIESLRLRSLPVEGTAVDEAGNQTLVRKVCAIKGKMGTQKGSMNVYVVFKSADSVALALKDNNVVMGEGKSARHVRIDHSKPSVFPPQRTVFLGGLPHYADEEELRDHFAAALPGGQEDIEAVRIVRDNETMVGKGIGYLLLRDRDAVMAALGLHQQVYRKRWALRVTPCAKRTKSTEVSKEGVLVKRKRQGEGEAEAGAGAGGEGEAGGEGKRKRPKKDKKNKTLQPGAMKRIFGQHKDKGKDGKGKDGKGKGKEKEKKPAATINLKKTVTRKKLLVERGQMKKEKGRKGKRLGGNVKKAMKAAKGK